MKKYFPIIILLLVGSSLNIIAQPHSQSPKLIVNIVVDQMKQDYLFRFWNLFGEEGFKKLVNEGYNFANCQYSYFPTYTAAGHACIGTGATPSVNGIVGNDWYENITGEKMYCVSDRNVKGVGTETASGQMSPRNLLSSTIGDELRLATNYRSKVYGVSLKDRGAILPPGHLANAAYWLDITEGNFVSSTYYMDELPSWVKDFNKKNLVDKYLNQTWKSSVSIHTLEKYTEEDNSPFENIPKGMTSSSFPYNLKELKDKNGGKSLIMNTPFGNSLLLEFTEALIKNEKIGKMKEANEAPDLLYVSFSSTDYIGHFFGIRSVEIADTYIRLDKEIASLIKLLEYQIGKDEFVIVLTADHAAADNPKYLASKKMETDFFNNNVVKSDLRTHLEKLYGQDVIDGYINSQIYLNKEVINSLALNENQVKDEIIEFMKFQPGVKNVFSSKILSDGCISDDMLKYYSNGYYPLRCGDVFIQLQPGWLDMSWSQSGTTHGSVYAYDKHVPLLFYGKGIPVGKTYDLVSPSHIASTLSAMIGISPPNGCTISPLVNYFDK
ncbi:MAG: alkaline phosphatase family protein [Chitinophagales bacterium]|nr:alkaline phosphatase family protein [Chitinophagales bacterium]MCZ2392764.1 alkaline phosphatase family protein [Chitinophagales bacterium]